MSGKTAKKQRQLFNKTMRHRAQEIGDMIGNNLRPKPKFIPMKVWLFFVGFFIVYKKKK